MRIEGEIVRKSPEALGKEIGGGNLRIHLHMYGIVKILKIFFKDVQRP